MTAQKGRDLLLKIDSGAGYVTIAGLRARRLVFNAETIDATDSESEGRWRELLAQAGVRRASISGGGIFRDAQSDELLRQAFFAATTPLCQILVPGFGVISGMFQITALEYRGNHDGELAFDIALESAGAISFAGVV